jgi:hypothetical protein
MDNQALKACIGCKQTLPDTAFHLSADGRRHPRCKKCRSEYERARTKKKKDDRLEGIEQDAVSDFCRLARRGGSNVPHSAELVETILEYMGGTGGFSSLFVKQYIDSPPGGAHRTRMLDTVARMILSNTAMGGAKKPLEMMTEEELEIELRRQVLAAAAQMQKVEVVDEVRNLSVVEGESSWPHRGMPAVPAHLDAERTGEVSANLADGELRGMDSET